MKRYAEYKDSSIEWIGDIPMHWNRQPLKFICNIQGRVGYKGYTVSDLVSEGEGPYTLGAKHISKNNELDLSKPEFISWDKYYESPEIMVQTGDLLLTQRGTLGKVAIVEKEIGEATINPSMVLLNKLSCMTKYLYYFFNSDYFVKWIDLTNTATAVPMISQEQLGNFNVLLPPHPEQTQIAQYLDHKTSQIDKLITDKEKLIELLNEERTAIINQAVTKGLNPDAPMKDSGIEWLGEVPAHWGQSKVKYLANIIGRIGFRGYTVQDLVEKGEGAISLSPSNIKNHILNLDECTYLSWEKYEESPEIKIYENDIVVVKTGSTIGKVALVPVNPSKITLNPQLVVLKDVKLVPKFLYLLMTSIYFQSYFKIYTAGGSTPAISQEKINNFKIVFPDEKEQNEIVKHVDSVMVKFEAITIKLHQEIQLLKEYKTALISEVVTGKVDVREECIIKSAALSNVQIA